jgi:hypothetical protein
MYNKPILSYHIAGKAATFFTTAKVIKNLLFDSRRETCSKNNSHQLLFRRQW